MLLHQNRIHQIMNLVFDNIVYSLQRAGGISRFWSKITEPYLDTALFVERDDAKLNLYRNAHSPSNLKEDYLAPKMLSRYMNFRTNFSLERHVFHSSYYRINRSASAINVTTVHDMIYEIYGKKGLGTVMHVAQKKRSLHAADCIVCVSEATRRDLIRIYPSLQGKEVHVIPNGVDTSRPHQYEHNSSPKVMRAVEKGDFFLYVGHRGACKGFDRVYAALQLCGFKYHCVVVGDDFSPGEIQSMRELQVHDRIVHVGRVSDTELNFLYGRADFFFFPSLYEGFGIPPLEAMRMGCPVLASNRSSIPEVVGDAGLLFDPDSLKSLTDSLHKIQDATTKRQLIHDGLIRAAKFSWDSAAESYKLLYERMLNER